MSMKILERFLVRLDSGPWSAVSRMTLGFCIPPVFHALSGGSGQIWISLALFVVLLIALRVVPAILRMVLPFSRETRDIWFQRRQIAKRHDSYQWQKLLWMGVGLLAFAAAGGGLRTGEQVLTIVCLAGGAAGLLLWRRIGAAQAPQAA
jgi:hypothetical protein